MLFVKGHGRADQFVVVEQYHVSRHSEQKEVMQVGAIISEPQNRSPGRYIRESWTYVMMIPPQVTVKARKDEYLCTASSVRYRRHY